MDPAALNLTIQVLGHGRFLFVHLDSEQVDPVLLRGLELLAAGLENMHFVDGAAAEDAARRGRIQYLRAQPAMAGERDIGDEGISPANVLIRLEGSALRPLAAYEDGLRAIIGQRGVSCMRGQGFRSRAAIRATR